MGRGRTRKWSDEQLKEAFKNSKSISGVLRLLGLKPSGSNYLTMQSKIASLNIDVSHISGQGWLKNRHHNHSNESKNKPLEVCMVENGILTDRGRVRRHLVNTRPNECEICGVSSWFGKPLKMQMDHINGNNTDHREENLRLICANCHSQTPTYCGRNIKGRRYVEPKLCKCGKELKEKRYNLCQECWNKNRPSQTKLTEPLDDSIIELVFKIGLRAAGKQLNISHTTLRKKLAKQNISAPKRNQYAKYK